MFEKTEVELEALLKGLCDGEKEFDHVTQWLKQQIGQAYSCGWADAMRLRGMKRVEDLL